MDNYLEYLKEMEEVNRQIRYYNRELKRSDITPRKRKNIYKSMMRAENKHAELKRILNSFHK
jgi:hypothetical protein